MYVGDSDWLSTNLLQTADWGGCMAESMLTYLPSFVL